MRNKSVESVNNVMGHRFVAYQWTSGFMGVDFDAPVSDEQLICRFSLKYASYLAVKYDRISRRRLGCIFIRLVLNVSGAGAPFRLESAP
jgi:hypothetical protein